MLHFRLLEKTASLKHVVMVFNTRIYNLSSGPHITRFFERANGAWQTADENRKVRCFTSILINFGIILFSNWYYISTQLLSVTKSSITYQ